MNRIKLGWARLSVPDKILKAKSVVQIMGSHAAVYPTPDPSLAIISAKTLELESAQVEAEKRGTDRTLVRNLRLAELTALMNRLVDYVQIVSGGDEELVAQAGMDVRKDPSKWPVPDKAQGLEADPGGNPGTIDLNWQPVKYNRQYILEMYMEVQTRPLPVETESERTEGTVVESGRWMQIASLSRPRHRVADLVSGQRYRFRVYAKNSNGRGDYSEEVGCVAR